MSSTPPTITIAAAANLLGIGRSSAYEAARTGNFPTPVLKINGRYVVPTRPLLDILGLDELPATA
ncbi:Helix-turn-helix domain-containing protein [Corynebacterium coyleae]|uniref:Helix-turn-helix domain-containing protein n=1 Tax=Corynebacterium coyleae TaxID=53374 RepID=A0ABX8L0A0_9CORY|nr:helix-turn-helix domain-containing protein [Corynebacterium coyleae]QXB18944.1 helix-turn-helix domain-containing protein [Corynebacterium coyleae]WJY80508.1 Helix-turn-helix domain protein [Corynebacterium coyleae]SEB44341.1 Helix-turn-helix domain-containing protein [Corynebacterium coyleae]